MGEVQARLHALESELQRSRTEMGYASQAKNALMQSNNGLQGRVAELSAQLLEVRASRMWSPLPARTWACLDPRCTHCPCCCPPGPGLCQ